MEKKRNKSLGASVLLLIVLLIVFWAAGFFAKNSNVIFPKLDKAAITYLEEGHDTYLFDKEQVLMTYLSKEYPGKEFETNLKEEKENVLYYEVKAQGEDPFEVKLKEKEIILKDKKVNIWTVIK